MGTLWIIFLKLLKQRGIARSLGPGTHLLRTGVAAGGILGRDRRRLAASVTVEKQVEAYPAKYEPITTESKANWARQQTINKKMRLGNWWKEHGSQAVAGITLVMLVFSFLLFAPKGVESMTEFSQQQEKVSAQQAATMQQMDELLVTVNRMLERSNEQASNNPIPAPGNETEAPN